MTDCPKCSDGQLDEDGFCPMCSWSRFVLIDPSEKPDPLPVQPLSVDELAHANIEAA